MPGRGVSWKTTKGGPRLAAPERSRATPARGVGSCDETNAIVLVITGPIARADIPRLCERARALLEAGNAELVCDVGELADPDAVTVDALARLQLTARRCEGRIGVVHACRELQELLMLMGLGDVVPVMPGLPLEARGQPEEREEARGIQEEGDPADAVAGHLEDLERPGL